MDIKERQSLARNRTRGRLVEKKSIVPGKQGKSDIKLALGATAQTLSPDSHVRAHVELLGVRKSHTRPLRLAAH